MVYLVSDTTGQERIWLASTESEAIAAHCEYLHLAPSVSTDVLMVSA